MLEYRMLVAERADIDGDRVVVGVIAWDGTRMRWRFAIRRELDGAHADRETMRGAVRAYEKRLNELFAEPPTQTALFEQTIETAFPVSEGRGGVLRWTMIRRAAPTDAQAYFDALCERHRLIGDAVQHADRVSADDLREGLRELGRRLAARHADRIRVGGSTEGDIPAAPALSWRNTIWHHALPVSLDFDKVSDINRRTLEIVGSVMFGVGSNEVPVLVVAKPQGIEARVAAENGTRRLREARGNLEVVEVDPDPEQRFRALEELIERDIAAPH